MRRRGCRCGRDALAEDLPDERVGQRNWCRAGSGAQGGPGDRGHQKVGDVTVGAIVDCGDRNQGCLGVRELEGLVGDELEHAGGIGAGEQFGGDVAGGGDPGLPGLRLFIEAGVVDGDTGGRGERLGEHFVVFAERLAGSLLGQIQVAEHVVADEDRHAEEGAHRGVMRRKSNRLRVVVDVVESDRGGVVDEDTEHTPARRQGADRAPGVFVDAFVDEFDQLVVVPADAERPVLGVDEFACGVHDGAQGGVELQAGGDGEHGVNQAVESVAAGDDLLDAVLDLAEQLAQSQMRKGVTQWSVAAFPVWLCTRHTVIVAPAFVRGRQFTMSVWQFTCLWWSSLETKTAAWVRRCMPSLASKRET